MAMMSVALATSPTDPSDSVREVKTGDDGDAMVR